MTLLYEDLTGKILAGGKNVGEFYADLLVEGKIMISTAA
jgi:hypothetical protein